MALPLITLLLPYHVLCARKSKAVDFQSLQPYHAAAVMRAALSATSYASISGTALTYVHQEPLDLFQPCATTRLPYRFDRPWLDLGGSNSNCPHFRRTFRTGISGAQCGLTLLRLKQSRDGVLKQSIQQCCCLIWPLYRDHCWVIMRPTIFCLFFLVPCVLADNWGDFTNNLATDLVCLHTRTPGILEVLKKTDLVIPKGPLDHPLRRATHQTVSLRVDQPPRQHNLRTITSGGVNGRRLRNKGMRRLFSSRLHWQSTRRSR